jgi:hypothetical protein
MEIGQVPTSNDSGEMTLQSLSNLKLINNPPYLQAMGYTDAAKYSPYPGEHPAGHLDAFSKNFRAAYQVATGKIKREEAVIPGVMIGHICVCVADAVERSVDAGGAYVDVDYRGVDLKNLSL